MWKESLSEVCTYRKPANIFLTAHGPVKILDFGLAKLAAAEEERREIPAMFAVNVSSDEGQGSNKNEVMVPAIEHSRLTRTGTTLGTTGYMSPEQIRKERLDARTDLSSFGLVLYEMTVGQRAFTGDTVDAVHEAILTRTPTPARDLNPAISRGVLINKALEKDRTFRCQSAAEMRVGLVQAQREIRLPRRRVRTWVGAVALLLAIAAGTWTYQQFRGRITLSSADTIVRADIDNRTGDAGFNDGLNTAMEVALEQTPYLNILGTDKMRETLGLLNLPDNAKVTTEVARKICLRTDSKMVLESSIADAGNGSSRNC